MAVPKESNEKQGLKTNYEHEGGGEPDRPDLIRVMGTGKGRVGR